MDFIYSIGFLYNESMMCYFYLHSVFIEYSLQIFLTSATRC
ncbi:protein of unknown function [Xenorhabdus doucetiae]|uniref:Uncharacterized protein n=1 Tax=Xenorhabdus doucetiae TaxID=351671 RepID=A0A068QVS2_9GAMM|nr:protein of unknown function [Xenorhabdus doucetiae]